MRTCWFELGLCGWGYDAHSEYPQWRCGVVAWGTGIGSMRARILALQADQERVLAVLKGEGDASP